MNVVTFWPTELTVRGKDFSFLTVNVEGRCDSRALPVDLNSFFLGKQAFTIRYVEFEHIYRVQVGDSRVFARLQLEVLDVGSMLDTMKACALMAGAILAQAAVELTDEPVDIEMVAPQRRLPEPKKELTG